LDGEAGRDVAADGTGPGQPVLGPLPIQRPLTAQRNNAARHSRPRPAPGAVLRRRLTDLVEAGARRPVTLLCAGPGWGKTVTVASWVAAAMDRVAWLTLHPEDNDRTVFWTHLVAALRGAGAVGPGDALAELEPAAGVTDAVVDQVLDGLDALTVRVVLVLDDFHELRADPVLHDLDDLLRYPPDRLRLVLLSRTEPSLRLHLLRAAGELVEIRSTDLAFRPDEAALLFANRNVRVSDEDLAALIEETQGWAAGLQLAVTALAQGRRIDKFAGDHGVADYLTREVLARLPPDVRNFLTRTSVLDEVSADLATAVTGERYSQRILESLERANAFVQGLGSYPRWFRYHPLLRDVLRNELAVESPELLPQLHRMAARWYSDQGSVIEALRHAAAGRDWKYLARQAVDWVPLMLSSDRVALVAVLRQIPGAELPTSAELQVCDALLLFHAGDYANVPARLAAARDLRAARDDVCDLPLEVALLTIEAAVVSRVRGDMPGLVTATTEVLRRLSTLRFGELPALLQYRAIALNNKGVGLLWTGQLDRADRYLWAGVTAARAAGLVLVEINAVGHLALLAVLRGALREAYEHATLACDLADRRGVRVSLQAVAGQLALALVEIEHNNVAEAERQLRRAVEAHRVDPEATQALVASVTRARLHMVTGDLEAARAVLRRARQDADPMMVAPALDRWHRLTQSEVDLASGHAEAVVARYGRHTESLLPGETVCLARAELALGGLDLAEALAARARSASPGNLVAVWSWTVTALVSDAQGHGNRSVDALSSAVRIAQREGIRRPFLSVGDRRLATLLERQRWLVRDNASFVADLLTETVATRQVPVAAPESDLSDRELEVLRYLPTVLTAAEIADELRVSVNTVKAHLRSIYRKLDVTRRREAVVRAREQGLI
jgi:LuxR family maltose regulon positive regulatory protein